MNNELLYNVLKPVQAIPAASLTGTTYNGVSVTGSGIDTQGYDGALIVLNAGTFTNAASALVTVIESATNDYSGATLVTGATFTAITTANDVALHKGFVLTSASKRYIWVKAVLTGDGTAPMSATVLLGRPSAMPEATKTDLVFCVDGSV